MRNEVIFSKIDNYTEARDVKNSGLYPYFRPSISAQDTEVVLEDNGRVLMLGSNSYMGLTTHPEVKQAAISAVEKYGTGCAGSRFLNGTLDIHKELEAELADWVGMDEALLYTTGFQVNQGVISTILGRHDHIFIDTHDHASIVDGASLSRANVHRYAHNNMDSLREHLETVPDDRGKFIVADGVFSMEGDIVNLPELVDIAEDNNAAVMIDDAHSIGVLGADGAGTASHFGMTDRIQIVMGTFSKSLAAAGGFVASDSATIEYLRHRSRAFIFSASMPPSVTASVLAAARIIRREPERLEKLWSNTTAMREGLQALGFNTGLSATPVIPLHVGDMMTLLKMCKLLEEDGVFVNPVLPPAVPPTDCLLRISLMATHTEEQIVTALAKLEKAGRTLGVI